MSCRSCPLRILDQQQLSTYEKFTNDYKKVQLTSREPTKMNKENGVKKIETEGSSTTDLMAYLTIGSKDKLFNRLYIDQRDDILKKFSAWSDQEQIDFVKNLLQVMSHHQHTQIEEFFQPMLKRDFITHLPSEFSYRILSLLDAKSLLACALVSKSWRRVVAQGKLWRSLIEQKVRTDSVWHGLSERRGWKKFLFVSSEQATALIHQVLANSPDFDPSMISNKDPYEIQHEFYCNLYPQITDDIMCLDANWKNGRHRLQRINCESENSKGVYCLQYDDQKIISGLRDTTIKIWRRNDLNCEKRLAGHSGSVLCLQYDERIIVSGSSDSTVRIWDVDTGDELNTLIHHSEAVLHLRFTNGMLVTCSKDRSIAVWDMVTPRQINLRRVLLGHRAAVNVVDFNHTYIVSASGDRTIKVWSADSCEYVRTLNGHTRGIACLQYRDRLVVSGSSDNTIRLWDIETGNCLRTLDGHDELVRCIRFDKKLIVSGAYDGKIKVWDLKAALDPHSPTSSICLKTLTEHTGRVFRLQFDDFQIVSSSHDDTILIWDFLNEHPPQPGDLGVRQRRQAAARQRITLHLGNAGDGPLNGQFQLGDVLNGLANQMEVDEPPNDEASESDSDSDDPAALLQPLDGRDI